MFGFEGSLAFGAHATRNRTKHDAFGSLYQVLPYLANSQLITMITFQVGAQVWNLYSAGNTQDDGAVQ